MKSVFLADPMPALTCPGSDEPLVRSWTLVRRYEGAEIIDNSTTSGFGRKPIGPPNSVMLEADAKKRIDAVAEQFGSRRQAAVIRAALRRLVQHPEPAAPVARYLEKIERGKPGLFVPIKASLDEDISRQIDQLAAAAGASSAAVIRVAINRLLKDPHNLEALPLEGARTDIGPKLKIRIDQDMLENLNGLVKEYGTRKRAAAVRLALRRLIANPGDLRRECREYEETQPRAPLEYVPVRFHIDDDLKGQVNELAERLGLSQSEFIRAAVDYRLSSRRGLENAVMAETFRDGPNRNRVIARHKRRMRQRAQSQETHPARR